MNGIVNRLTAIFICIHHALNPTPHTHLGETVAYSIKNCCKSTFKKFPRTSFVLLAVAIAVIIKVVPVAGQYLSPSLLQQPEPTPVYPHVQSTVPELVRKRVVDLTASEKAAFVNAVNTLHKTIPEGSNLSIYEQFVLQHVLTMGFGHGLETSGPQKVNPAHGRAAFLPWHRQFLREFERTLQTIDPVVTVPYWDWTDPKALDVILQDNFLGSNGQGVVIEVPGLGTFEGGPVVTGALADWTLNEALHFEMYTGKPLGDRLIRFVAVPPFNQYPLPKADTEKLFSIDHYEAFNALLEGAEKLNDRGRFVEDWSLHAYIHTLIGGAEVDTAHSKNGVPKELRALGTMDSIPCSPYDPIFWLLHANVDRLWAEWQDQGHTGQTFFPVRGNPFGHNLSDPMFPWDGGVSKPGNLGPGNLLAWLSAIATDQVITPADVLDFRSLGYNYDTTRLAADQ
ncbi:tyrosinase family protein [Oculatella sp. LEGE 06141]|uniref:tyrosinase family protein n=1 Tax=Oculatella sp. LEGE 06141 TaxID=1828648 RepID=UPI00187F5882|nr:tyrosinase family protein [Oculatella sp. LEGE 06141]MBE9178522.1 tyrosinase family protein [Oculatella sp. LEGE 06141]